MTVGAWKSWLQNPNTLDHRLVERAALVEQDQPLFITQDSRQFAHAPAAANAFVAIAGLWHDGHDYVNDAYAEGARYFIVSEDASIPDWEDADVVYTADPLESWQSLARHWRDACDPPVIAITGSNGKTTVKEWLIQLLSKHIDAYGSPRSFNSQVGVPLALGALQPQHECAVIEAGISEPGEMERLEQCIRPRYGVLTHLGDAHAENFSSPSDLRAEKLKLFAHCQWVVVPEGLHQARKSLELMGVTVHTWGAGAEHALKVNSFVHVNGRTIEAVWNQNRYVWSVQFTDEIGFRNAMTAALTALVWGMDPLEVGKSLLEFQNLDHRMQRIRKSDGLWVLSDAYTNDWDALQLALLDLNRIPEPAKKAAIVGPIPGMDARDAHRLMTLVEAAGTDLVWAVGSEWKKLQPQTGWRFFDQTEDVLTALKADPRALDGAHVLVKGPRLERFERVVSLLSETGNATRLVVDLEALTHNLRTLRTQVRNRCKTQADLIAVIKASGYGTNATALARVFEFHRIPIVAVACTEEGIALRKHGITLRILVLNPTTPTLPALIANRLEPTIHTTQQFDALCQALREANKDAPWPIHLKIDSGMHRLGFEPNQMTALLSILDHPATRVKTLFSHLASADRPEQDAKTQAQLSAFAGVFNALKIHQPDLRSHILNTAGLLRFPEAAGDYVRVGIGLMGIQPDAAESLDLQPVVRFETVISSLHKVPAHEGVGYGLEDAADHERILATLPVGYADGFPRNLSNGVGSVVIHETLVPVVGKVCMDMVMVDVTSLPKTQVGDAVELFGLSQRIESFAADAQTIPYEILTRIPSRVAREQRGN